MSSPADNASQAIDRIEAALIESAAAHAILPGLPLEGRDRAREALAALATVRELLSEQERELERLREERDARKPKHEADKTLAKCIGALQGLAQGNPKWEAILTQHHIPVNAAANALHQVLAEREAAEAELKLAREGLREIEQEQFASAAQLRRKARVLLAGPSARVPAYDRDTHQWIGQCPHGDVCTGCDAVGYCTREEPARVPAGELEEHHPWCISREGYECNCHVQFAAQRARQRAWLAGEPDKGGEA